MDTTNNEQCLKMLTSTMIRKLLIPSAGCVADQSSSQLLRFDKMLQQILVTVAKVIGCFTKLCLFGSFAVCYRLFQNMPR